MLFRNDWTKYVLGARTRPHFEITWKTWFVSDTPQNGLCWMRRLWGQLLMFFPSVMDVKNNFALQTKNKEYRQIDTSGLMNLLQSPRGLGFYTLFIPEGAFLRFPVFVEPAEPIVFLRSGKTKEGCQDWTINGMSPYIHIYVYVCIYI